MGATGTRRAGVVIGSLVGTVFGLVFVEVNSGGLPGNWPTVVRIAGAVVGVVLLLGILRASRLPGGRPDRDHGGFSDRRYWTIVGIEGFALMGGLFVLNAVFERPEFAVAWIAVVVGVHFVGLAKLWHMDLYLVLGGVMTALGVIGFVIGATGGSAGTVGVVSGVGSGVALFATVAAGLVLSERMTATA
jgi:hypothetical protein